MDLRKLIDENVECVDTPNGKYLNREQVFESIKLVEEKLKSPNTTKVKIVELVSRLEDAVAESNLTESSRLVTKLKYSAQQL